MILVRLFEFEVPKRMCRDMIGTSNSPHLSARSGADAGGAAQMSQQQIEREKARRRRRKTIQYVAESLAAPVITLLLLVAWQFGAPALGLSDFILPTPWQIIKRIGKDYQLLLANSLVTLLEMLAGFLIAAAAGVVTALAIFYSRIFERAVYPLLVALQTIPKVALAPLLVLYLGYDFAPKCFLAFLLAYFPIVIATVVGLQALDKSMVDLVRSMGATERQTFFKIRLPAALPNVFGGLKVGASLAVIGAVIGEYVAAERGLGKTQAAVILSEVKNLSLFLKLKRDSSLRSE
jgi:NitT/TauT family transport system permease protein